MYKVSKNIYIYIECGFFYQDFSAPFSLTLKRFLFFLKWFQTEKES